MRGISPRPGYKRNIIKINKMEEVLFMKQNCVNLTGLLSNENVSKLMLVFLLSLPALPLASLLWTDLTCSFRFL